MACTCQLLEIMYLKACHLICLFSKVLSVYWKHSERLDTKKKKIYKIPRDLIWV